MHTRPSAIKTALFLLFLLPTAATMAQDTLDIRPFERYWTKSRLVPKGGLGIQETAFVEFGVQLHKIYVHPLSLASAGPYLTVDGMVWDNQVIVGPKAGYEITAGLFGLAADFTCYSDFDDTAWVFTPRAGLTLMGFVDLFYGRNLPLSEFRFEAVDENRFSLVFNLNRDYFSLKTAPKRSRRHHGIN